MSSESELPNSSALSPKQKTTSKSQKASLIRIVKAQVTLLISNLNNDNFTRKSTEIHNLIETHGQDIGEHLFRYLLSDIYKQHLIQDENSPQLRLLKENAKFSTEDKSKSQTLVSFALALEQFCKSEIASQVDLLDLFDRLELDAFDKLIVCVPLFSGVKPEISEKAKIIFASTIQNALPAISNIKSIPNGVLQYFYDCLAHVLSQNAYQFDYEKLQSCIEITARYCLDKSNVEKIQRLINSKPKKGNTYNDQQFKQSIIEMYNNNPSSVARILDMTKELNALPAILDSLPPFLALDLASLADYCKLMNLEAWLRENLKNMQSNVVFASQCLDYLGQKIALESQRQEGNINNLPIPLSLETISTFLKVLSESPLAPQQAEAVKEVQNRCLQTFPKLMNVRSQAVPGSTGAEVSFKPDVEEEANLYYERIYNGELSIESMIELLQRLNSSKDAREQDVFACMIHNLFDEYSFFPKYPDKELSITSILFGSLIQHRLVSYVPLGIALRYVWDALRNPLGSKMFNFGVQALKQFQNRLSEWPQYCSHLLQIPDLAQAQPELVTFIQAAMNSHEVRVKPGEELDPNANQPPASSVPFTSVHVPQPPSDTAEITYMDPTDSIQDKILFIINNVAHNNIDSKVTDLAQVLKPSSFKWFSHYLVVKRVSSEPNYHELYILVLDSMNSKLLYAHMLSETYANILILLNSEKTVSNSSERALLKNLGSWLGRMTLAKNKPILHKHIAFKDLLLEGYDTQRLIVVIPFVCKVLEHSAHSVIFKPPNPWLMAILKLLVELYEFADLKLNLKFEIEVLCKSLSLELKDIVPTTVLKTRQPQNQVSKNAFAAPGAGYPGRASAGGGNPLLQNADAETGVPGLTEIPIPVPNLAPYIAFNPQIALYSSQPAAKRLVLQAFTESIREIIGPVVERAVAIAVVSTRDLVSKDFVMEMDENKMRKAAHMMAQNLAASLAMVTSKEPLRLSIVANLRSIFLAHGLNDSMAEQAIILTVADNLDLMCAVIEKAAMEKATMQIDDDLATAFANRKKHREQRPNQPFVDMDVYKMSGFSNTLPQLLRPKPSGLQPAQLSVYEDFMRIPRAVPNPSTAPTSAGPMIDRISGGRLDPGFNNLPYGINSPGGMPASVARFDNSMLISGQPPLQQQGLPTAHMILERFAQYITEIEKLTSQSSVNSVNALPQHSSIRDLIRQIPILALSSFDKAEAARTFAQKVVQLLYKSEKQLTIEVYVVLLEHLCEVSPNVRTLVTSWLTHADDERKYNVPVTVALIKAGLINLPEQDQELSILIDSGRISAIEFTARLIRACLFGEYPLATRHEFMASLEALSGLRTNQLPESVLSLLEDMRKAPNPQQQLQQQPMIQEGQQGQDAALRDQLQFFFAEWVRLYQHPATTEKTMLAFATQLSQHGIFKVEDVSSLFYRVCIEASVEHAVNFKAMPGQSPNLAYQPIDALSKLIVCLIQVPLLEGQTDPLAHFTRALTVTVLCISHHHEIRGKHFNQRPFLRLFTCILSDLHAVEQNIQSIYVPLLTALSNTLYTLQPSHFTGFTFAWLQLISHRLFMPQLLLAENQQGWPTFQRLLVCLFQFLAPYLHKAELRDTTRLLYRGTLRVLLVLLHDFPEFLCDYHYSLCDVIPSTCIQMRNLILSAFPRNMRLPDPFTPNLKIDLLPEIQLSPRILSDFTIVLENNGFKKELDQYLELNKTGNHRLLKDLANKLKSEKSYNVPLMNALVLYIGTTTITNGTPVHQGSAMEIYQYLLSELDSEGRYLFLSAIANQLRYPNSHTHYFSCVLLYLFVEGKKDIAKEQITRVLLERLIVNRPHPWGLLITFIELIKNPRYSFWSHSFTRCAADIERLFESVSRSINQN